MYVRKGRGQGVTVHCVYSPKEPVLLYRIDVEGKSEDFMIRKGALFEEIKAIAEGRQPPPDPKAFSPTVRFDADDVGGAVQSAMANPAMAAARLKPVLEGLLQRADAASIWASPAQWRQP